MKIVRQGESLTTQGTTFTGRVTLERAMSQQTPDGVSLSIVHFEDGARTFWHEHPGEQILYVLEGEGRVGTEQDEQRVQPGDVVYAAPGERHWHGAVPGGNMTHISVTTGGSPTWFDPPED